MRNKVTTASTRSSANGTTYPPLCAIKEEQRVAIKDAPIKLKLIMLKLVAKYPGP